MSRADLDPTRRTRSSNNPPLSVFAMSHGLPGFRVLDLLELGSRVARNAMLPGYKGAVGGR